MAIRENGSVVVNIADKEFKRDKVGVVHFDDLAEVHSFFTDQEIVALVERQIYHMEYQKTHHKKYTQKIRDLEAPVKAAAKRMFPGTSYINLTPEQHKAAMDAAFGQQVKEEE